MKQFKKLISIMLTVAMTLAMTVTAFAANADPSEAPAPATVNHSYEIYQIFTGDYDAATKTLSNIKWGSNAKAGETAGKDVDETTLETIEALKDTAENQRAQALAAYADLTGTPFKTVTGTNADQVTVEGTVPAGYYLIKDEDGSQGTGENANYTLYVVQVTDGNLTFNPKVGVPTVDKEIKVDGEDKKDSNGAIGDVVNYEFTGTMPSNIDLYNTYFYRFTDTLSKGLEYNDDIKIELVNGETRTDVTRYFWKNATTYDEVTGTTITVSIQDIKAFAVGEDSIAAITADTQVVVTYSATIRENAVVGNPGNPNKVDLEYSNNPNDSGTPGTTPPPETPDEPNPTVPTGKTPESEVVTYTTELAITKTMEGNGLPTGVEFTLTGTKLNKVNVETGVEFKPAENGTYYKLKDGTYTTQAPVMVDSDTEKANTEYYDSTTQKYERVGTVETVTVPQDDQKVVATVDSTGKVTFAGLSEGEYVLKETATPDGYNKINDIKITITYNNGKFTVSWTQVNENNVEQTGDGTGDNQVIVDDTDNTFSTTILNKSGSLLPSTGGIGTTIFYIVGAVLVIGAAILLVTKKRMSKEA